MQAAAEQALVVDAADEEIDAVLAEFSGDPRQAIRALLHASRNCPWTPRRSCRAGTCGGICGA